MPERRKAPERRVRKAGNTGPVFGLAGATPEDRLAAKQEKLAAREARISAVLNGVATPKAYTVAEAFKAKVREALKELAQESEKDE